MKYTIVTTAFNDEKNIIHYLDNVTKQTFKPAEIIIADGGSKDDTVKTVEKYATSCSIPVRILSGNRLNIAQGFNEAIRAATTDYVAVTGIGNTYAEDCFELLRNGMIENHADFAYPPVRGVVDNEFTKEYCRTFLYGDSGKDDKTSLNHGVLIKKEVFETVGYFYEKFFYAGEDSEFYEQAYQHGFKGICVREAKLWWETPKNMKELRKQIRVYTIGAMQILSNKALWLMYRQRVLHITFCVMAIICLLINPLRLIGCGMFLVMVSYSVMKKVLRRKNQSFWLRMYNDYMPLYFMLKNREYFKIENKVNRGEVVTKDNRKEEA